MLKPKSHLLALRLIQNAKDYLQGLLTQEQLATLQAEVWQDALAEGVGDDLVGLFCPPEPKERQEERQRVEAKVGGHVRHQGGVVCQGHGVTMTAGPAKAYDPTLPLHRPVSQHAGYHKPYVPPSKAPLLSTDPKDSEHPSE